MTKEDMRRIAEDDIDDRVSDLFNTYKKTPILFDASLGKIIGAAMAYYNLKIFSLSEALFITDAIHAIEISLINEKRPIAKR